MFALILSVMIFHCPRVVHEASSSEQRLKEAAKSQDAESRLEERREELLLAWLLALGRFHATQGLDAEAATREMVEAMNGAFRRAWLKANELGQAQWGFPWADAPSVGSEALLRDQGAYMGGFLRDVVEGLPGKNGRLSETARTQLYGAVLGAAFQQGMIDRAPPHQEIQWRLGLCKHCRDCPNLAAGSPYTLATLPTFPRAGATACGSRCCCWLEFRTRPSAAVPAASVLSGYLLGGTPLPNEGQDAQVRRIYAARRAERSTGASRAHWQRLAASASSETEIALGTQALDGRAARAGDIALLFSRWGLFGLAVSSLPAEQLEELLAALLLALELPPEKKTEASTSRFEFALPAEEVVVASLIGNGLEAQRAAMFDCVRAMAKSGAAVSLAPLAQDGFAREVDRIGIWIRGEADQVRSLLTAFAQLHAQDDVEVATWSGV